MTSTEARADRFIREMGELKIPDPSAGRSALWLRLGAAAMVLGPILTVIAYLISHNTSDPLEQRDAIVVALIGISVAIVGSAVYLRYSLTGFLRFWMARQSYDLGLLAERAPEREAN